MRCRTLVVVSCILLSGCGGPVLPVIFAGITAAKSGYDIANEITQAVDPIIAKACVVYENRKATVYARVALGATTASTNTKISSMASFADAACAQPPNGNPFDTAFWIAEVGAKMEAASGP